MAMSSTYKLRTIRMLMFLSQVLLVAFLCYWLNAQYNGEREELRKDLIVRLESTSRSVIDSNLIINLINPFIKGDTVAEKYMKVVTDVKDSLRMHSTIA